MSVLKCGRAGCGNIMCDRLSDDRQEYICEKCFGELMRIGPSVDLNSFMRGDIVAPPFSIEASRAYFDSIFPEMHQ